MRYSAQHLRFLAYGYRRLRVPALTAAFNIRFGTAQTEQMIKSALKNHRIVSGRPRGYAKGECRRVWTREQIGFIRKNYRRMSRLELTEAVNREFGLQRTVRQVKTLINNARLHSGRTGRFEKGLKPWNTGLKGSIKPNSGSFQKGHVPASLKPMGAERVNVYGYIEVKVDEPNPYTACPTRYRYKHHVVWESLHGPIPAGHVVTFKDGDRLNCDPDNLQLLSRGELAVLNKARWHSLTPELRPAMVAAVRLLVRAGEIERRSDA